jgi:hypothetical protein
MHFHQPIASLHQENPFTTAETQKGVRATTAAAAPSPQELTAALLAAAAPRLAAAPISTLTAVLAAAGQLLGDGSVADADGDAVAGADGDQQRAWLAAALEGAEAKVGGADNETLAAFLGALAALGRPPPPALAAALLARLGAAVTELSAPALAAALAAVQRLRLGADGELVASYLDRCGCAGGGLVGVWGLAVVGVTKQGVNTPHRNNKTSQMDQTPPTSNRQGARFGLRGLPLRRRRHPHLPRCGGRLC